MSEISIVFPHQLFENSVFESLSHPIYIIEEHLFFTQYKFHKQKLAYHRATMQHYKSKLESKGKKVVYIEANNKLHDVRILLNSLSSSIEKIHCYEVVDYWLKQRLVNRDIDIICYNSPMFINTQESLSEFFEDKSKFLFQTKFYINQRKKHNILLDTNQKPLGGKWTYDAENRKKYPKTKVPPTIPKFSESEIWKKAVEYVNVNFKNNPGGLDEQLYPITPEESNRWVDTFLTDRFSEFGIYEDAIVIDEVHLNHSIITPMLNIGLITPKDIVNIALLYSREHDIPINSTEGFVRQIIGWREFIRGVYSSVGSIERTTNFWKFRRKIPQSFYDGTTGIAPLDDSIKKVLKYGYCHHIERLMIIGNLMLLCEFDPDEVYEWFMELFIDAYDWVMVPNVYGMSQFADGGMMATKPYISGSNYIFKMSNYKKGEEWQSTWDGLFWRFMDVHRDFFLSNPRLGMLIRMYDKMPEEKQQTHLNNANQFLESLDKALLS